MSTKVITGKVRFSYANVFKPTSMEEGQDLKYNCMLLVPKTDKVTIKKIRAAEAIALADLKVKLGGKIPATAKKTVLRDGDEEHPDDEVYEGMFFMGTSSKNKPGVVDVDREEIMGSDQFYSGCWGKASINIYGYTKGKKGITAGLNNLLKLEDGENLGGSSASAVDDFGTDEDDEI